MSVPSLSLVLCLLWLTSPLTFIRLALISLPLRPYLAECVIVLILQASPCVVLDKKHSWHHCCTCLHYNSKHHTDLPACLDITAHSSDGKQIYLLIWNPQCPANVQLCFFPPEGIIRLCNWKLLLHTSIYEHFSCWLWERQIRSDIVVGLWGEQTLSLSALSILTPALLGATLAGGPYPTILLPAVRSQPVLDDHT